MTTKNIVQDLSSTKYDGADKHTKQKTAQKDLEQDIKKAWEEMTRYNKATPYKQKTESKGRMAANTNKKEEKVRRLMIQAISGTWNTLKNKQKPPFWGNLFSKKSRT